MFILRVNLIIFLAFSNPLIEVMSWPNILIIPFDGDNSPVRHLKQVVLPDPDTPSNAKHSPYSSPKEISFTATKSP